MTDKPSNDPRADLEAAIADLAQAHARFHLENVVVTVSYSGRAELSEIKARYDDRPASE